MGGDETQIAVAVVSDADRALIGRRPPGVPLAGLWEFPGGKVADGENPSETAARECLEETGVAVRVGDLAVEVTHLYPHGRLHIRFFAATPIDPGCEPRPPFRWVRRSDLRTYAFPPANAAMCAKLAADDGFGRSSL